MAGSTSAVLAIRVIADTKDAIKGLKGTVDSAQGMQKALTVTGVAASATFGAIATYTAAGAKSAAADAKAQVVLAQALKGSAGATKEQIAQTERFITSTSHAAGVTDDELRPAMANLVRGTRDVTQAQEAMGLALDVSAATGKDLNSVTAALSKAYAGNTVALGRLFPALDKTLLKSGDMTKITAELSKMVGGTSAAAAQTAAGQYERLKVMLGDLQETVGYALLPILEALMPILINMAQFVTDNSEAVTKLIGVVAIVSAGLATLAATTKAYQLITSAVKIATTAWTAAQWLLNVALSANPIGLVIAAVAGLIAVITLAWKHSETFRNIVTGAFEAVKNAAVATWEWIKNNWSKLLAILTGPIGIAVSTIIKHFDKIKSAAQAVWDFIQRIFSNITSAFSNISGIIDKVTPWAMVPVPPGVSAAPIGYATMPAARTAAPAPIVVNISGAIDPEQTARQVRRVLDGHDVRQGRAVARAVAW